MKITVNRRTELTKAQKKSRLREGLIPGAIYGRGLDTLIVEVPAKSIANVLMSNAGQNTVLDLSITGEAQSHSVIIDNLERDPITRNFKNVGFHKLATNQKITAHVPIQIIGTLNSSIGADAMIEQTLETISVQALPNDLPAHIDVDISGMSFGDVIRVIDLPANSKIEYGSPSDAVVVSCHASSTAKISESAMPITPSTPAE